MLLDVQLLGFQNENNLETRDAYNGGTQYCCCDNFVCSQNKDDDNIGGCSESCDIFFNVKLSECQYPIGCSITTMNAPITDSPSASSSAYHFSFILNSIPPQVSPCISDICVASLKVETL